MITTEEQARRAVRELLQYIGEDTQREGLIETPKRIVNMWKEILRGYDTAKKPTITVFNNGMDGIRYNNMIVDSGTFYSLCEHHAIPFIGKYHFAYIPHEKGKILGLSKVARVVDYYAARLQIQERLGRDIINALETALDSEYKPLGMAMHLEAEHLCKSMRGVKKQGKMQTSVLTGIFMNDHATREEFMTLINVWDR